MPLSSLADLSLASLSARLQGYGSSLQGESRDAISALLQHLEAGLKGTLGQGYFLSSIDPGIGKTLSVITFLRTWKDQGYVPSSSVLIGLSRLDEIKSYVEASGLDRGDFAVLTRDPALNDLGLPPELHGNARVLFTTQQMIERRTRDCQFAEAVEFHFDGRPRDLRIWDESLVPAVHLVVSVDDIAGMLSAFKNRPSEGVAALRSWVAQHLVAGDKTKLVVPEEFADLPTLSNGSERSAAAAEALSRLAGREVLVLGSDQEERKLAGSSRSLPADFAPVIILDASGRVRSTYDVWERELGTLHRLPAAANDYRRLSVHLWEHAVGKVAVGKQTTQAEIVDALAEAIKDGPDGDWLVISYKDHSIEETLRAAVDKKDRGRLNFLTWGRHHGTNQFKHCRNVVLIGQLTYGKGAYAALASAVGVSPYDVTEGIEQTLKAGEYKHGWLQALTRASVRNSQDGFAGECEAFIIASPRNKAQTLLAETFRGCTIEPWTPSLKQTRGKAAQLIGLLEQAANDRLPSVRKADLAAALGVTKSNFSGLLKHRDVADYIERKQLWVEHSQISGWPRFDPWSEGDFVWANREDVE